MATTPPGPSCCGRTARQFDITPPSRPDARRLEWLCARCAGELRDAGYRVETVQ